MKGLILSVNVRCLHVSVTSPGGGIYNPAHPKPFHISKDVNGHIRPTPVIMKKGYGCVLCKNGLDSFGYKDVLVLRQFLTPSGHLMNRRQTGVCERMQQRLRNNIRRSMAMGYLPKTPYDNNNTT
jgi:ribosomal protein S18